MNRFDMRLRRLEGEHFGDVSEAERTRDRVAARWRAMIDSVDDRSAMMEFDRHRESVSGSRAGSMYDRVWKAAFERECGYRMDRDGDGELRSVAVDRDALEPDVAFVESLVAEARDWIAASGHGPECSACDEAMIRARTRGAANG